MRLCAWAPHRKNVGDTEAMLRPNLSLYACSCQLHDSVPTMWAGLDPKPGSLSPTHKVRKGKH